MKKRRGLLIQSNALWAGIYLTMAVLFLGAFAVQIGAAPLGRPPKGTPEPGMGNVALAGLFDSPVFGPPLVHLPLLYGSEPNPDVTATPTATSTPVITECTPSEVGFVLLADGADPFGSAANEANGEVFVAEHGTHAVKVVKGTQIVTTVSNGDFIVGQPYGVAYNPLNSKIYVTDEGNGQLLIIDPTTYAVEKALGGLDKPRGIGIDRNTGVAYVASPGTQAHGNVKRYTLADVASGGEGAAVEVGNWPTGVVVDKQGRVWITTLTQLVRIIWPVSGSPTTNAVSLPGAFGITYNGNTQRLYVTTGGSSSLIVFDVQAAGSLLEVSGSPFKTSPEYNLDWVAVSSDGARLFVAGRTAEGQLSKLWVFDTVQKAFLTPFDLDSWPDGSMMRGVSYDPKFKTVYVSSEFSDSVYVLSDCGGTPPPPPPSCEPSEQGFVPLGDHTGPFGSASDEGAAPQIFVANHDAQAHSISIVHGVSAMGTITDTRFGQLWGVAYNPLNGKMYVTDDLNGMLWIIDAATHEVEKSLGGLDHPHGVAIDRDTGAAYVASNGDGGLKKYTLTDVANGTQGQPTLNIGGFPSGVVVDSQGRIWVANNEDLVRVIWTGNGTTTNKWGVTGAFGVAYNATKQHLYVTSGQSSELLVYDITGTDPVRIAGPLKTDPEYNLDGLAVNPATGRLYVNGRLASATTHTSKLWVLDGNTDTWLTSFDLDSWNSFMPGVSVDPIEQKVYASSDYSNNVYVVDDCP